MGPRISCQFESYGSDKGIGKVVMHSARLVSRNAVKPPILSLYTLAALLCTLHKFSMSPKSSGLSTPILLEVFYVSFQLFVVVHIYHVFAYHFPAYYKGDGYSGDLSLAGFFSEIAEAEAYHRHDDIGRLKYLERDLGLKRKQASQ